MKKTSEKVLTKGSKQETITKTIKWVEEYKNLRVSIVKDKAKG